MGVFNPIVVGEMQARCSIREGDIARLRRGLESGRSLSEPDAATLLQLNDTCPTQDPGWTPFFAETLAEYIVHQVEPQGYLTAQKGEWLIDKVATSGRVRSAPGRELLLAAMELARWSPASLCRFALQQVVLDIGSPSKVQGPASPGSVTRRAAETTRRILVGCSGGEMLPIASAEVAILIEIDALTKASGSHPEWTDLFVKVMANAILTASGYRPPARAVAFGRERWLEHTGGTSDAAWTAAALKRGLAAVVAAYRPQTPEQRALRRLEQQRIEIITSESVSESQPDWLSGQLADLATRDASIAALLGHLAAERPSIHPALKSVLQRYATAA